MNLKSKDSITRLKKMANKKLGVQISDVDELQNNDTLYIYQGEAFYKSLDYFVNDWDPCMLEILDTAAQDVRRSRLLHLMRSWFCTDVMFGLFRTLNLCEGSG
ncbi:hypothetical protein PsorP6_004581 [Peronosclerospora sorghi]|uniref:Uncharacterized protein n=1 Tax=Peronosclerospora sorghi TaxID=230839 RepID=A0ACC0VLN6_9STRA|nr:hypothetical protein PsorP6_004581 [Peronosclerospora sorghi]